MAMKMREINLNSNKLTGRTICLIIYYMQNTNMFKPRQRWEVELSIYEECLLLNFPTINQRLKARIITKDSAIVTIQYIELS